MLPDFDACFSFRPITPPSRFKMVVNWLKSQGYPPPTFVHADSEICTNEAEEFALDEGFKLELTTPECAKRAKQ